MRKTDVLFHSDGFRPGNPAIKVKCYHFGPSAEAVAARFGCDKATASKAVEYAWEMACEDFWRQVPEIVAELFPGAECYSEGRCSGWLVVHGLPDVGGWDAVMLGKWAKLRRLVASEIKWRASDEQVLEDIEANQWAKPGAERYNFVDDEEGHTSCIADLKTAAVQAGYGAVVRG